MNKIKKLSVVFIAMAMVALLGVSVFAIDQADVAYSAKITDNTTRCVSSSAQEVTVAINATKEIELHSLTAKVALPEGWTIKSMSNTVLGITEDYYNTENGMVVWYGEVDEQNPTKQILQIVIEIPAGTIAGTYDIGLENIELGKISVSGNDWQEISKEIDSLTATITINDHKFETTASTEIAAEATCSTPALYYVKCDNCPVVNKEKVVPVGDPAANAHNYPATPSSYIDNGDGTHSPKYVCTLNSEHVNVDATVKTEHKYDQDGDKCVCGAVKPVTNISVVHKGNALASAYTIDGQVVTVTYSLACKVGYYDATAGKYVALTATKVADNCYSFTAPEGVTEVILAVKGDVNGDCIINAGDAGTINAHALGRRAMTAEQQFIADVQAPIGVINAADAGSVNADSLKRKALAW